MYLTFGIQLIQLMMNFKSILREEEKENEVAKPVLTALFQDKFEIHVYDLLVLKP